MSAPADNRGDGGGREIKQGNDTAQMMLYGIEPSPFNAQWPEPNTLPAMALDRMLKGERLTQPSFGFHGWRLAAYIKELEYLGWSVARCDVPPPPNYEGTRPIRMYWLTTETVTAAFAARFGVCHA